MPRRSSSPSLRKYAADEAQLVDLLSAVKVVVYTADREGRITSVVGPVQEVLGYSPEELLGKGVEIVAPESVDLVLDQLRRKLSGEADRTVYAAVLIARGGSRVLVYLNSVPLRRGGEIAGVGGIACLKPAASGEGARVEPPVLTPRQLEVLRLLADGLSTREIAARLGLAGETARNHIRALLRELGAHSRLEAVVKAQRLGLL